MGGREINGIIITGKFGIRGTNIRSMYIGDPKASQLQCG